MEYYQEIIEQYSAADNQEFQIYVFRLKELF